MTSGAQPGLPALIRVIPLRPAQTCRDDFRFFVKQFWGEVPGAGTVKWNWHLDFFCDELQKVAERVFQGLPRECDVVCNIPFGASKSTIWSILFPAWIWTRMPTARILTASHTDELVLDLSNKAREVIRSEKYRNFFPEVRLSDRQDAKGYYTNTVGGDRKTCTVAGKSPTGFHAHFIIVDDPIDPKKVLSEASVNTAREFMTNVVASRKVDKRVTVTLLVMQRLGLGDPTDVMLSEAEKEGAAPVRHLCLPSDLDKNPDGTWDTSGIKPQEVADNYKDGLLDPVRLDRVVLAEYAARGALFYSTQLRQKPYAKDGGLFREEYFNNRCKNSPYECVRVRFWDRAATGDGGCASAGTLLARNKDGAWFVEDVVWGKWEPVQRNAKMRATALKDRARYGPKYEPTIWVEAEGGASGKGDFLMVARALQGFTVREWTVVGQGDKVTRAGPWSAQCAALNVWIVDNGESQGLGKATWDIDGFIKEHCAFPLGLLKDRVDSASGAFAVMVRSANPTSPLRSFTLGRTRKGVVRVIALSGETLGQTVIEEPAVLVAFRNPQTALELSAGTPPDTAIPVHGMNSLLDSAILFCADADPSQLQSVWDEPFESFGRLPAELTLTVADARKLWALLTRQRAQPYAVVVLQDDGDRRAISAALAVRDSLRASAVEVEWVGQEVIPETAPNQHVYDTIRKARNAVV